MADAAAELLERGCEVTFFTSRYDPARCFSELCDGRVNVRVVGRHVPASIGGRLRAPSSIARMALAARAMASCRPAFDVVVCDLVSHVVPLIRRLSRAPVVFYCHYPDLLLAPRRHGVYRYYRRPLDRLEARGIARADRVLVNSRFTASVLHRTFPGLPEEKVHVVHPGVAITGPADAEPASEVAEPDGYFLCLGRFVPEKNMVLAIEALAEMRNTASSDVSQRVRLVIAGSCDERLPESTRTLAALRRRAVELGLADRVNFRCSIPDAERNSLLGHCRGLLHCNRAEHFGISLLEAMAAGRPVVAVNNAGPVEIVLHGETGYLCDPSPGSFAAAMTALVEDPDRAMAMGVAGRLRVEQCFSRRAFGDGFEKEIRSVL